MVLAKSANIALLSVVASLRHPLTVGIDSFQGLLNAVMIHSE